MNRLKNSLPTAYTVKSQRWKMVLSKYLLTMNSKNRVNKALKRQVNAVSGLCCIMIFLKYQIKIRDFGTSWPESRKVFQRRSPSELPPLAVWQRFPCKRTWEPCGLVWASTYVNGLLRHTLRSVRYSTFPLTIPFAVWFSLSFRGGRGCGGRATEKTNDYCQCNGAEFAVK